MRASLFCALTTAVLASLAECGSGFENGTNAANAEQGGPEAKRSLDVSFIPEDCFFALVIHPKRITDSPLAEGLSEEIAEWTFSSMSKGWGFDPRKAEQQLALVAPHEPAQKRQDLSLPSDGLAPWRDQGPCDVGGIIRFAEPIADKELVGKMFRDFDFSPEEATHEGRAYYRGYLRYGAWPEDDERPAGFAVHLPDDRTMVFSASEPMLKKMLSASEVKSGLVQRLRQLGADHDLIMIATTKGARGSIEKLAKELEGEMFPATGGLLEAAELGKAATLTADLRADPVAELVVEAYDADDAVKLIGLIDETLTAARSLFKDQSDDVTKHGPPGVGKWVVELVEQVFDGVAVAQDGDKVAGTLKRPKALARLPEILTSIVQRELAREGRVERRPQAPGEVGMIAVYEVDSDRAPAGFKLSDAGMRALMGAIDRRLNPSGRTSGRCRQLGDGRIEVSIFRADPDVMQRIADLLARPGTIEFRILANQRDHPALIERARKSDAGTLRDAAGNLLAWWVPVQEGEENSVNQQKEIAARSVRKNGRHVLQVLVVNDPFDVTGAYLERVVADVDYRGEPCVAFTVNRVGARLFGALTGGNLPDPDQGFRRKLGIIIDGWLHSALAIMSRVSKEAQITGRFTQEQVQDLVDLLNAGSLPVAIRKVEQRVVDAGKQPSP